jgi:hypothetical protein
VTAVALAVMTAPQVEAYQRAAVALLGLAREAGAPVAATRAERKVVQELSLHVFRQVPVYAVTDTVTGDPVGVLAASFTKRPVGEWGRYVNVYVVHTKMGSRGAGYATAAYQAIASAGTTAGCRRLTTTAGTVGGWRVHRAMRWPAWGLNDARQVVTDADLAGDAPPGLPHRCAKLAGPGRPLTPAEHAAALTDLSGPYRAHPGDLPDGYRNLP